MPIKKLKPKDGKTRVALCVPSLAGMFNHDLMIFINDAIKSNTNPQTPFYFQLHTVSGKQPVHLVRNILADSAVTDDSDIVWWLDDDSVPPPGAFAMLPAFIESQADILGAVTPVVSMKESGRRLILKTNAYEYNKLGDLMFSSITPVAGQPEIQDVDACGMSATLMRIGVLNDPRMHLPREYVWMDGTTKTLDDGEQKVYFKTWYDSLGNIIRGEDFDFCQRAKGLGYKIMCHFGIQFGHNKVTNLSGILEVAAELAKNNWQQFANDAREAKRPRLEIVH